MRNAFNLKNIDFTNYDDIQKELINLRKKHMAAFLQARKAGEKAVLSKSELEKKPRSPDCVLPVHVGYQSRDRDFKEQDTKEFFTPRTSVSKCKCGDVLTFKVDEALLFSVEKETEQVLKRFTTKTARGCVGRLTFPELMPMTYPLHHMDYT
ncbi:hypothetical protein ACROYT_G014929 [Oculina patagonica]